MNYNLLWFIWLIWATALLVYCLSLKTVLLLISDYREAILLVFSALIACYVLIKNTFNKEVTMFKRKESGYHPAPVITASPLPASMSEGETPEADSDFIASISSAKVVSESDTTTIPASCVITGEVNAAGDIHINGTVKGKINSEKTVFVQKNGHVEGEIYAQRTEITGTLKGTCCSREVAVNASGFMDGTIECESLSVNQQARFYGHSKPWQDPARKAEKEKMATNIIEPAVSPGQDFHLREQRS